MVEWKTVKLSEVLRYRKGNILINNDEEYSLCRVQLHRRGIVLREKKIGSQIKTKKQQVCRAGDLVVAEMDAKFGGYGFIPDHLEGAIVSSHYYLYELDKNKITQEYFEILIKTDFIQNQIEAKGSTNYSSIRAWEFLDYEIPLQSIALQNIIAAKYLKHSRFKEDLGIELNTQLKYLSQLRQRILQEAIEGKLTANWRVQHPDLISGDNHASKLLEKIKTEKERLIKKGKFKKDKPLEPISDDEKPFDLPDDWVWCRIGETGLVERGVTPEYCENSEKKILNQKCVRWNRIEVEWSKPVLPNWFNSLDKSSLTSAGHVLVNSTGEGTIGRAGVVNIGSEGLPFDTHVLRYRSITGVVPVFLMYFINSSYGQNQVTKLKGAKTTKQTELGVNNLCLFLFPLPSLSEQQEIVKRVNKLMDMIDELEKQVSERKEQSKMLMQSVLREAFAGNK